MANFGSIYNQLIKYIDDRNKVINEFKKGEMPILVATDVAGDFENQLNFRFFLFVNFYFDLW
jgi:hypothetical protein